MVPTTHRSQAADRQPPITMLPPLNLRKTLIWGWGSGGVPPASTLDSCLATGQSLRPCDIMGVS